MNRFNFLALILFLISYIIVFLLLVSIKVLYPQVTFYHYFNPHFFLLTLSVLISGIVSLKFFYSPKHSLKSIVNRRVLLSGIINLILFLFVKFFVDTSFYGLNFLIIFAILLAFLDFTVVYLHYALVRSRKIGIDELIEEEAQRKKIAKKYNPIFHTKTEIVSDYVGEAFVEWINKHVKIESEKTAIFATTQNISIEFLPHFSAQSIINLRNLNDIGRINKFLETVNDKLPKNGMFIGVAETIEYRNQTLLKKHFFPFNYITVFFDFLINRVLPKVDLTQDIYFSYTKGANRALSKAEILGRLYSCGFESIDNVYIGNRFVFCAKKIQVPFFDNNPTYGPFVSLKRIGKDKKQVIIYKLRTMYPYSEYIQKLVYEMNGTLNGDKAEDDFRITGWGRFFRKIWLDELPMIINLFNGDVKLVGVRPISKTKFDTYPIELQDKRTKSKPGLIPPFYADMPKTQDELFESENRYLDAYFKSPFKTDFIYLCKALVNIFIKNARSK